MFGDKNCPHCGKKIKSNFHFCPYCGESLKYRPKYRNIFEDVEQEFEKIDKMFGPVFVRFPKFGKESPFKGGGINIVIKTGGGMKPRINVRTSGRYKKLEPRIKRRLGVRGEVKEVKEEKRKIRIPKITEEPETKVEKRRNEETITIKLPDVKKLDDIEIRKLGQSIEIKAFAGDKAYFKLVPIKPNAQISDRSFKDGTLKIEVIR